MRSKKGEIVSCVNCGRDTSAKDGICSQCRGGPLTAQVDKREVRGRKQIRHEDTCIEPAEPTNGDYEENAAERYHGESIRDDI
jgi:hypothetical protein